jgi:hypothetical protein
MNYLRDTVQNPYLLHPHTSRARFDRLGSVTGSGVKHVKVKIEEAYRPFT